MPDLSHSSPNDGQGFAASTSTAVDGRGDASTLLEAPSLEQMERDAFERAFDHTYGWRPVTNAQRRYDDSAVQVGWVMWCAARASTPVGSQAAQDVLAERKRQIEVEGWDAAHDDHEHEDRTLARAAACYAMHAGICGGWDEASYRRASPPYSDPEGDTIAWPWGPDWWNPKNPRRDLIRAGALILAEIERLDRAAPSATPESQL